MYTERPDGLLLSICIPGFLQSPDGVVLKPVLGHSKGHREMHFYQKMFGADCQDRDLLSLRQFVPKFLGIWTTPEHPGSESVNSWTFYTVSIATTAAAAASLPSPPPPPPLLLIIP